MCKKVLYLWMENTYNPSVDGRTVPMDIILYSINQKSVIHYN